MISDRMPDETKIIAFQHLLDQHDLDKGIFEVVKAHLKATDMAMKQGRIIDVTLIVVRSSTKNEKKKTEKDPEMHHSVAKGNQCFFEMRCDIGVDAASGLLPSDISTAANLHELNNADGQLHVEETVVYRVSVHLGIEKRETFEDSARQFWVGMRLDRAARHRAGFQKTHFRGLKKSNKTSKRCSRWPILIKSSNEGRQRHEPKG